MRRRDLIQRGFTLLELMVALAIMAVLAAGVTPLYTQYVEEAKVTATKTHFDEVIMRLQDGVKVCEQYVNVANATKPFLHSGVVGRDPAIGVCQPASLGAYADALSAYFTATKMQNPSRRNRPPDGIKDM